MAQKEERGKNRGKLTRSMYALAMAAVVYLAAAYTGLFVPSADPGFVSMLVAIGTAMLAAALVRAWMEKKGEPMIDERTMLVHRVSVNYSWWISYVVIAALLLVQQFKLAQLSVEGALSIVFFSMIASLIVFRLYFSAKGDLQ